MHKNLITPLVLICTLYFSCSKKGNQPTPQNGGSGNIKIELVSGNNQTDTIGRLLANPVVVKVTATNGASLSDYGLLYQGSGCNEDYSGQTIIGINGTGSYGWYLAGDVGQQTLKVFVIDAQNKKIDSVTAVSTGLSPGPGWHFSACSLQGGENPAAFCKLSTGRLFVSYLSGRGYLKYSDDNGVSWRAVKSLGNTHSFITITSTPADELFALALDGNYYSKDAGQTWTSLGTQPFNTLLVTGMVYTPSGKLLVSTKSTPLFISPDKGKTWTSVPPSALVTPNDSGYESDFAYPSEDKDGNLYLVGQEDQHLFQSKDGGKTWNNIYPNEMDFSFYIDNNNWFYKHTTSGVNGASAMSPGIYISKNSGVSYSMLVPSPGIFCGQLSVQSDGNFYYSDWEKGLYRTNGISSSVKEVYEDNIGFFTPYIVAKNNNIIVTNVTDILMQYYQK